MSRAKVKTAYVCSDCGAEHAKWQGQCNACGEWNTLSRVNIGPIKEASVGFAGSTAQIKKLIDVDTEEEYDAIRSDYERLAARARERAEATWGPLPLPPRSESAAS